MKFMTTTQGKEFHRRYYDAREEMSSESVEYGRGIPVVKTFGQSIFSFKRFYNSIIRYKEMVHAYTVLWRKPMSFYAIIMQSAAFFLIPMAIFLSGRGDNLGLVLTDFVFYLLISPTFSMLLMRSMYFNQNTMIAQQAIDRIDNLFDYPAMGSSDATVTLERFSLEFKDVVFSYEGSDKRAVDNISFSFAKGRRSRWSALRVAEKRRSPGSPRDSGMSTAARCWLGGSMSRIFRKNS